MIAGLLFWIGLHAWVPQQAPLPEIPAVELTGQWTAVALPDYPLALTAVAGKLWVAGADEMIAVSADGGHTWTMKHRRSRGELLNVITFVDSQLGYALGTGNMRLKTSDGGETWVAQKAPGAPLVGWRHLEFADELHGVGADATSFAFTSDGGYSWVWRNLSNGGSPRPIEQVAIFDATHAVALFAATQGAPGALVWTTDAGKTWLEKEPQAGRTMRALRRGPEGLWLYGSEQTAPAVPATNGGRGTPARTAPVAALSTDGETWTAAPAPLNLSITACLREACRIGGGWVDLSGAAPKRWRIPQPGVLTAQWAAVVDSYCQILNGELNCLRGEDPSLPAARAAAAPAPVFKPPQCRANCGLNAVPAAIVLEHHDGPVHVVAIVSKQGEVTDAGILESNFADSGVWVMNSLKQWRFTPATLDGQPVAAEFHFTTNVHTAH